MWYGTMSRSWKTTKQRAFLKRTGRPPLLIASSDVVASRLWRIIITLMDPNPNPTTVFPTSDVWPRRAAKVSKVCASSSLGVGVGMITDEVARRHVPVAGKLVA